MLLYPKVEGKVKGLPRNMENGFMSYCGAVRK